MFNWLWSIPKVGLEGCPINSSQAGKMRSHKNKQPDLTNFKEEMVNFYYLWIKAHVNIFILENFLLVIGFGIAISVTAGVWLKRKDAIIGRDLKFVNKGGG